MNTRFLTLLTTLAFLGFSVSVLATPPDKPCQPWPGCKNDDPEPPPDALYTVELSGGPFQFGPTVVSVNSKGNLESSAGEDLLIWRPNFPELSDPSDLSEVAWNKVFDSCAGTFSQQTDEIGVGPSDWKVGKNSDANIHIDLKDIILEQGVDRKEIQIHLRGIPGDRFLPVCDTGLGLVESEDFDLDYYTIWGKPWSGPGRSWDTCYHFDGVDPDSVIPEGTEAFPLSKLTISISCL